jgi:hypothetical protein
VSAPLLTLADLAHDPLEQRAQVLLDQFGRRSQAPVPRGSVADPERAWALSAKVRGVA